MKLKTRLIIGFMSVIILPLLLSVAVIFAFSQFQMRAIEKTYGISGTDYKMLANPVTIMDEVTENTYQQLEITANRDAERFLDENFLESINKSLQEKSSYLIVRQEGEIIYDGNKKASEIHDVLPEYGEAISLDTSTYIGGEYQVLIKQIDYLQENGAKGTVFIVTGVSDYIPEVKAFIGEMLFAIVIILALTAGLLIAWIYQCVVVPLGRMKIATQNIKDGNLDFELEITADDEIGQLCRDFEEMRLRLKETSVEKVEYDKRNKELISNISHDLKTPITAIKGYVEGIMDGVADTPEKMERYIRTIYNKANDMDMLINELTLYSKIDSNRIPYNFNTISVNAYFDDCAEDLNVDMIERGIKFDYQNYVEDNVKIIADAEQLKRVINNIVSNSAKYMDKAERKIHLRVKDVGDFVQVEIEDNGKGIGTKELPYIFERFYRTDASRNSATGGSGIGLSIVKKIIEEHGGKIWATSREGIGTVMYFVLRKYQEVPANE